MAFISSGGQVIAFAEYSDIINADQRLFEANEGLADETVIEDLTIKATSRILQLIRNTGWWKRYYLIEANSEQRAATQTLGRISVPLPNSNLIIERESDFTDLCVYLTFSEYLLPKVADFGNADSAEVKKIGFYNERFRKLFSELIESGDWYDWDNSGVVTNLEKLPNAVNLVRAR
jgi:hypothetical protein